MTMTDSGTSFRASRPVRSAAFQESAMAGPCTIRQVIQAAVDSIEDGTLKWLWPHNAAALPQARAVLAALTLCYARQIYSSMDAAWMVAIDPAFFGLCGGQFPDASVLRRFRAENREAIRYCLTAALHFLVTQKVSSGAVTKINVPHVVEEANRRIITAMFVDSMELDGE